MIVVFFLKKSKRRAMGLNISQYFPTAIESWRNPALAINVEEKSTRDPMYGFAEPREERSKQKQKQIHQFKSKLNSYNFFL